MGVPPLEAGALQTTVAEELPACAETFVGSPGTVSSWGVIRLLGEEKGLVPTELLAATVN